MARRKNTKRIDPRYFLEETTNRDQKNPDLGEYEPIPARTMYGGDISNEPWQLDTSDLPDDRPEAPIAKERGPSWPGMDWTMKHHPPSDQDWPHSDYVSPKKFPEKDKPVMPADFAAAWDDWKKEDEKVPEPDPEPSAAPTGGDQFDWLLDEVGDLDQFFAGGSNREGGLHPAAAMGVDVIPYDVVRQHARDKHGLRMKTHEDSRQHWFDNWREIVPMAAPGFLEKGDPAGALRALYKRADAGKIAQLRASGLSDEQIRTGYRTPEEAERRSMAWPWKERYQKGDYSYFLDPDAPAARAPRSPPERRKWEPYKSGQWGTEGPTTGGKPREDGTPYPRERNYLGQDVTHPNVRDLVWTKGKWRDSWEEAPEGTVTTGEPEVEKLRDEPRFLDLQRRESLKRNKQ